MIDFFPKRQNAEDLPWKDDDAIYMAHELFLDSTSPNRFVSNVRALARKGFDLNGLHHRGYSVGYISVRQSEPSTVHALAAAGYNYALDAHALDASRFLWRGSLHRTVAQHAHTHDPSIRVPTMEEEARSEVAEAAHPSFRGLSIRFKPDSRGNGLEL